MKRKLIKTGENTHVISLPITWVRKNNLSKGDFLEILEEGSSIIVYPNKRIAKTASLNFENEDYWYIQRLLRKLYSGGYDTIDIHYKNVEQLAYIRRSIRVLEGFDITSSESNHCIIKTVISPDNLNYEQLIKDILWLIRSQIEIFYKTHKSKKDLNEVKEINETVVKLCHLGRRLLNLNEKQNSSMLKDSFLLFTSLIYMSSYLMYAADELSTVESSISSDDKKLIKDTLDLYDNLLEAYKSSGKRRLDLLYAFFDKREHSFESDLKALNSDNPVLIHFIISFRKDLAGVGNYLMLQEFVKEI